jgi:hypothetical protein
MTKIILIKYYYRIGNDMNKLDTRYYLHVPFEEKDEAYAIGCKWDGELKQWYITESNPNYDVKSLWTKWLRFY